MNIQIVIYTAIFFFISEMALKFLKKSKADDVKKGNDKKSLMLFWITIPLSFTLGFYAASYGQWDSAKITLGIVGLSLFWVGFALRWISIFQLSKEFTVDVVISKNHNLKTDGIYAIVRHPSYLGLLIICLGLSVAMNSIISLFVVTLPILFALIYRIKVEESVLNDEFGIEYKNYAENTFALIPKIF